jgi:hypothetical protein
MTEKIKVNKKIAAANFVFIDLVFKNVRIIDLNAGIDGILFGKLQNKRKKCLS